MLARVGNCAAEPDVVLNEVDAAGILEELLDIHLPNAVTAVGIPSVVPLAMVAH